MTARPLTTLTVREYARLTTSVVESTLDRAQISESAFDWLCELSSRMRGRAGAELLQVDDRRWLRLDNYVGVLQTPCGLRLEILPKHVETSSEADASLARGLLKRMLEAALDLSPRSAGPAHLELFDQPLLEWIMRRYLDALEHVARRGMRHDYLRVEEEQPFLKGQLDVVKQMRAQPARQHVFNIRHDIFSVNRAENRLLKSALIRVAASSRDPDNWRKANEMLHLLAEVPESQDWPVDFRAWHRDRLMAHYVPARPWCELVLGDQMPLALAGKNSGISLLFPMERLFERFVGNSLRARLPAGYKLTEQTSHRWLCEHDGDSMFMLKPDFLIEGPGIRFVLDAKWKLLDAGDRLGNYGLSQSDFYQLYAYGKKYLDGHGPLALVVPATTRFAHALPPFHFDGHLTLHALPMNLATGELPCMETIIPGWVTTPKSRKGR